MSLFRKQKQRLFGKTKTVDEAFEEVRGQFKEYQRSLATLSKDVGKATSSLANLGATLPPLPTSLAPLASTPASLPETIQSSIDDSDTSLAQVASQVARLERECAHLGKQVKERDDALLLADAARERVGALQGKPGKLQQAQQEAERTDARYIQLNEQVGQALMELLEARQRELDDILRMMVTAQVTMFRELAASFRVMQGGAAVDRAELFTVPSPRAPSQGTTPRASSSNAGPPPLPASKRTSVAPSEGSSSFDMGSLQDAGPVAATGSAAAGGAPPVPRKSMYGLGGSAPDSGAGPAEGGSAPPPSLPKKKRPTTAAFDPFAQADSTVGSVGFIAEPSDRQAERMGDHISRQMESAEGRSRMGNAIASNTDSTLVAGAAQNATAQRMGGKVLGAAARNKTVQKKAVAEMSNPKSRRKALGIAKKGL